MSFREEYEKMIKDRYRPGYHFAAPGINAVPGDPNGAFYADGEYHLMYLYRNNDTNGFHWGHIKSRDLLHWTEMPDALTVNNDEGCFSGGAFVDDDGCAYLSFWKFADNDGADKSGIAIAKSKPPYAEWERITPIAVPGTEWGITDMEIDGEIIHLGCADPSNIWKSGETYYMQLGNLCVLNKYGREEDSEDRYKGGWTELFKSKDLKKWEFVHRFYEPDFTDPSWPDETEDDMCPSFLPLPDKMSDGQLTDYWLQLFISHNKGCQYYIGKFEDEKFIPEKHGRMSWNDYTYFAPEALIDGRNRHMMWTWLREDDEPKFDECGWAGVYSFPRVVWLENDELHMAPAEELDNLEYDVKEYSADIPSGKSLLEDSVGDMYRIKADIKLQNKAGFIVRADKDFKEYTEITVDRQSGKLVFVSCTKDGKKIEEAPFTLGENENLHMDIFVDRAMIEVYVNERQAMCRRMFFKGDNADGIYTISDGSRFENVIISKIEATNAF